MAYRSIEFRGFHADECGNEKIYIHGKWVNGFWVFGNFVKAEKLDYSECEYLIIEVGADGRTYDVIPETVGQYIGQTDVLGNKIYEDDVVEVEYTEKAKVVYNTEKGMFTVVFNDSENDWASLYCMRSNNDTIKVIGNLYDGVNYFN